MPYRLWGPWGTGLRAPEVKRPPTWKLAFNTVIPCLRTLLVAHYRGLWHHKGTAWHRIHDTEEKSRAQSIMRANYYGNKTLTNWHMNLLAKKHAKYYYSSSDSPGEKKWERFRIPEFMIGQTFSVFVFALHIYLFHLMLQSVLFRVMNTSIMGAPCDIGLCWKDGDPRKIVPQGP